MGTPADHIKVVGTMILMSLGPHGYANLGISRSGNGCVIGLMLAGNRAVAAPFLRLSGRPAGLGVGGFSFFVNDANAAITAAASARVNIVAKSPVPFALIVQSDDPGAVARLRQQGAWMLLDARGRGLCDRLLLTPGRTARDYP